VRAPSGGPELPPLPLPISVEGSLAGQEVRQSLRLRDWERAQELVRAREAQGYWEVPNKTATQGGPISISETASKYVADAEARQLSEETIKKYKRLFKKLESFAGERVYFFCRARRR
jgi:hypothetical protein